LCLPLIGHRIPPRTTRLAHPPHPRASPHPRAPRAPALAGRWAVLDSIEHLYQIVNGRRIARARECERTRIVWGIVKGIGGDEETSGGAFAGGWAKGRPIVRRACGPAGHSRGDLNATHSGESPRGDFAAEGRVGSFGGTPRSVERPVRWNARR
jgi:hypothetical protein